MADRHSERLALVNTLYALTGGGDWAAAEAHLTDDFFATEADHLPFAGTYAGKGGLRALFEKVMGMADVVDMQVHETTVGEDYAVTLVDLVFAQPVGSRVQIAEMFRFRGDKICEIRPYYFDPAPVFAAVEAKRAALAAK
jgi:ketosteroid isomerase-like protein